MSVKKRFLVPLDGSVLADRVVNHVMRPLLRRDDEVLLLSVVEPDGDAEHERHSTQAARDHLEGIRNGLLPVGVASSTHVVTGAAVAEILSFAAHERPDLICMATHGRTGIERLLRGSVAEGVLRGSSVPLLMANPWALLSDAAAAGYRRILLPIDQSNRGAEILPHVEDLAHRLASEVLLLQVETVAPGGVAAPMTPIPPPLVQPRTGEEIEAGLTPERLRLEAAGVPTRAIAAFGPVADAILEVGAREQIDLVAMETHGRKGIARLVLGSVAEKVLRHGRWAVLVSPTRD